MEPERGLAQVYIDRIRAVATRALHGEDVDREVSAVVREAQDHFLLVRDHDPAGTLEYFVGQLRFQADHVDPSQEAYQEALRKAALWAARATQDD